MTSSRTLILISVSCFFLSPKIALGQCCAGGSGCTIAGNVAQGVLQERQLELSSNFQFIYTDLFYKKDQPAPYSDRTFDSFSSTYQYFKLGYGLSKDFTFSVETGYYFQKKETGFEGDPLTSYLSEGFADLLLFPKYNVFKRQAENHHDDITLGLGYKIPLGSYNDSIGNIEPFSGQTFYVTLPTSVQLSSGAQEVIFHTLLARRYIRQQFSFFISGYYILKGYNPNGEKLGDYMSLGIFASQTLFDNIGVGMQVRYEQVQQMKINESVFLYGKPSNYYPEATGYNKIFLTPQVSFSQGRFSVYASYDWPIYQYLNTSPYYTQAASEFQATIGLSYRFFIKPSYKPMDRSIYQCPMHPDVTDSQPSLCTKCKMLLIKKE